MWRLAGTGRTGMVGSLPWILPHRIQKRSKRGYRRILSGERELLNVFDYVWLLILSFCCLLKQLLLLQLLSSLNLRILLVPQLRRRVDPEPHHCPDDDGHVWCIFFHHSICREFFCHGKYDQLTNPNGCPKCETRSWWEWEANRWVQKHSYRQWCRKQHFMLPCNDGTGRHEKMSQIWLAQLLEDFVARNGGPAGRLRLPAPTEPYLLKMGKGNDGQAWAEPLPSAPPSDKLERKKWAEEESLSEK